MSAVVVVGPGRLGLSLAAAFARSGTFREVVVFGRHARPPGHPVLEMPEVRYVFGVEPLPRDTAAVLLAVPDAAVPEVTFAIAGLGRAPGGCAAFHLSGTLPTDVLEPLHRQGFGVGSFYPLVSVTDPLRGPARLAGSYVAVTAGPEVLRVAHGLGDALGAEIFAVPAVRRPLFHAAVTLTGSALPALLAHAGHILEQAGIDPDEGLAALVSLMRSVLDGVDSDGLRSALPGPLARGDVETTALHLRALDPEDQRRYAVFAREILRLGSGGPGQGASGEEARGELEELLGRYVGRETTGAGAEH
jgi:predicted short-subunit dehydrogenase-like oxidoreductase (DUF2520 family)